MHSGSVSRPRRRHVTALVGIALLAVALSVGAASAAGVTVTTPPTGGGVILPPNLNGFDLAQVGYQRVIVGD